MDGSFSEDDWEKPSRYVRLVRKRGGRMGVCVHIHMDLKDEACLHVLPDSVRFVSHPSSQRKGSMSASTIPEGI